MIFFSGDWCDLPDAQGSPINMTEQISNRYIHYITTCLHQLINISIVCHSVRANWLFHNIYQIMDLPFTIDCLLHLSSSCDATIYAIIPLQPGDSRSTTSIKFVYTFLYHQFEDKCHNRIILIFFNDLFSIIFSGLH